MTYFVKLRHESVAEAKRRGPAWFDPDQAIGIAEELAIEHRVVDVIDESGQVICAVGRMISGENIQTLPRES